MANGLAEYYAGKGEAPGRWVGRASRELGLSDQVTADQFRRMFAARNPASGELLGREHRQNALPAYDLVFRPVKSVSVLWAVGDAELATTVRAAHIEAVDAALAYLERNVGTRRGTDGVQHIAAKGLLAARWDHRTSRAGDPLLHSHVVVANRVQGIDGRWSTIDGRDLYAHATAADALYRAEYQRLLTERLQVRWGNATRAGNREIEGVPASVIRHFSKRSEAIEVVRESREAEGLRWNDKVANWIAHQTRPDKVRAAAPSALQEAWRQQVRDLDARPEAIVADASRRGRVHVLDDHEISTLFDQLAGPEGLTLHASTFSAQDVRIAIGKRVATVGAAEVERLAEQFLADPRVVAMVLPSESERQQARYSTVEMLQSERRLVANVVARHETAVAQVSADSLRIAMRQMNPQLGPDQEQMVRDITTLGRPVSIVVGRAGTGKTYALHAAHTAWRLEGISVVGCAPTGIAAEQLEHGAEIPSSTVDRLLYRLDTGAQRLDRGGVLVVDEAAMLGTRKLQRLHDHVTRAEAKLVLVGDDRQLQSIEAGGGFRALRQRLGASALTVNRRQLHEVDRAAVELVRAGEGAAALRLYEESGRFTVAASVDARRAAMLNDWWKSFSAGDEAVMLTLTRAEADHLNNEARLLMYARGKLGSEHIRLGEREFAAGDHIVCRSNAPRQLGVVNGTRAVVEGFDAKRRTITIRLPARDGRQDRLVTLPEWYLRRRDPLGGPAINHAYAVTTHRTQALTVDTAFIDMGGTRDAEWAYVALSRVRQSAHLYAVEGVHPAREELDLPGAIPPDVRRDLAAAMSRSRVQELALDLRERPAVADLSTRALRAERDRLVATLGKAPQTRSAEITQAQRRSQRARELLDEAVERHQVALGRLSLLHATNAAREAIHRAQTDVRRLAFEEAQRRQEVARLATVEALLSRHEQQRQAWMEATGRPAGERLAIVEAELALRRRHGERLLLLRPPPHVQAVIGRPAREMNDQERERWLAAAKGIQDYCARYGITDPERPLGPEPALAHESAAFTQLLDYRRVRDAVLAFEDTGREAEQERRGRSA